MADELKTCPFCGGPARFMIHPVWQVQAYVCKLCGAIGPSVVSPSTAANLWNRRDDADRWRWQFPEIAEKPGLSEELEHIAQELEEARTAGNDTETAIELMDTIHACETALRIMADALPFPLDRYKRAVIDKNARRGYYGKGQE